MPDNIEQSGERRWERSINLIAEIAPLKRVKVERHHRLVRDLGFDSVAVLELLVALENEFEILPIPSEELNEAATVGDIEALVKWRLEND